MRIRKTLLATQIALVLSVASVNSYAGDVEVTLPAATDAFTVDQPAGTELMRVHGDGKVGIGTATPSVKLHVSDAGFVESYVQTSGNTGADAAVMRLLNGSNTLGGFAVLANGDNEAVVTNTENGPLYFGTNNLERMRIMANGNMGIGTTTPSDGSGAGGQILKLDVEGAVGATHYCDNNGENCVAAADLSSGGNAGTAMAFKVSSTDTTTTQTRDTWHVMDTEWTAAPDINTFATSTYANGVFTVGAGESGLYEIFAKTNIGGDEGRDQTSIFVNGANVGSSSSNTSSAAVPSPAYALVNLAEGDTVEVQAYYTHSTTDRTTNCSVNNCYLTLQKLGAAATSGGAADNLGNHTATQDIDLATSKLVGNGGSEGIAIDATGNVGMGTDAPIAKLHIQAPAWNPGLAPNFGISGNRPSIVLHDSNEPDDNSYSITMEGGALEFASTQHTTDDWGYDEKTNIMSLLENGNVGIGTNTPSSALEIIGDGNSGNGLLKASDAADDDEIMLDPNFGVTQNRTDAYFNNSLVGGRISLRVSDAAERDTVALTAASNGDVGIGTSTPEYTLDVMGHTQVQGSLLFRNDTAPADNQRWWFNNNAADGSLTLQALNDTPAGGGHALRFTRTAQNINQTQFLNANTPFAVFDHSTQRIGIGTDAPSSALHVVGTITETSDERLKEEIKPIENALDKVMQLEGVNFQWKAEANQEKGTQMGLIAQQVESVIPEVVKTAEDEQGTKSVAYSNIVAVLIEAIKEQQQRIEKLEAQVGAAAAK